MMKNVNSDSNCADEQKLKVRGQHLEVKWGF